MAARTSARQSRIGGAACVAAWVAYWLALTLAGSDWDGPAPFLIGILLAGAVAFAVGRPQVLWLAPVLFLYIAIYGNLTVPEGTDDDGKTAPILGLFVALYSAGAMLVGFAVRAALTLIRRRRGRLAGPLERQ